MKRILTIQDISGVGKCSLTVALPIISAMGVECSVLPTAVLSAHTMFPKYTFHDLTGEMLAMAEQWRNDKLTFDAIYTGYLASAVQMQLAGQVIEMFHTSKSWVLIDPVMADNGRYYARFDDLFASAMAKFCAHADVITPNLSEVACLLQRPYLAEDYSEADVQDALRRLAELGPKTVVITGVSLSPSEVGIMGYEAQEDRFFTHFHPRLPGIFHGTGDIFASTAVGGYMRGLPVSEALALAEDMTYESIRYTIASKDAVNYGVEFERALPMLISRLPAIH